MGVCETLMPLLLDVMAPEVHRNDHSYVRELSKPTFDSLCKNLAWWAVTRRSSKKQTQNCQNWGVGACAGMGAYPGQYGKTFLYKKEMLETLLVRGV